MKIIENGKFRADELEMEKFERSGKAGGNIF
jgi:hypothetical protein